MVPPAGGVSVNTPPRHYKTFVFDSSRWDGFRFRPGDIVISTPPKCGTTWTQRILALLVFQNPKLHAPLTSISPWIDMLTRPKAEVFADLEAQTHRRFIKSHTPLDGLPLDERVTYVCVGRDPRDVMLSWDGHVANANMEALFAAREKAVGNADLADMEIPIPPETLRERFWAWIENDMPPTEAPSSLVATLNHLESFWKARDRSNVVMLHYDDLKANLEGEMRKLASRLGIAVPEELWPALAKAATFEEMKRDADNTAPGTTESIWQDNKRFFRSGKSGGWRELFEAGDTERYETRLKGLADPALVAWARHGSRPRA
jgi:aryl sulfotransferase